jgi:hypothetical protein
MRARHRHLNPGDAGASVAYDSRYKFSVADGASIATWQDRTRNNINATTGATEQPTYETNELNGNPAIKFDGVNDRLSFARSDASEAWAICVAKRTGTSTYTGLITARQSSNNFPSLFLHINNDVNYGPVIVGSSPNSTLSGKGGSLRVGEWRILFVEWIGGGTSGAQYYRASDNGAEINLSNSGSVGAFSANLNSVIGAASNTATAYVNFWPGLISQVSFGISRPSASLRKRLIHSSAYSFKLSCS